MIIIIIIITCLYTIILDKIFVNDINILHLDTIDSNISIQYK